MGVGGGNGGGNTSAVAGTVWGIIQEKLIWLEIALGSTLYIERPQFAKHGAR